MIYFKLIRRGHEKFLFKIYLKKKFFMKMYEPLSHGGIQGYQNNSIFVLDKIVEIIIISHKLSIIIFNKSIIILSLTIEVKFCNM